MSGRRRGVRNLEIVRVDARPMDDGEFASAATAGGGGGGGLFGRLMPKAKQKSYESLLDVDSPEEAAGGGRSNLIDFSPPPQSPQSPAPAPPRPSTRPTVIRPAAAAGGGGGGQLHNKFGSVDCLSARCNPSFRKESTKAKAAPPRPRNQPPPRPPPPQLKRQSSPSASTLPAGAQLLLDLDFGPQLSPRDNRPDVVPRSPPASRQQRQQQQQQTLLAKFELAEPPEAGVLQLNVGDRLLVDRREDDNWYYGRNLRTGRTGLIPANYAEPMHNQPPPPTVAPVAAAAPVVKQRRSLIPEPNAAAAPAPSADSHQSPDSGVSVSSTPEAASGPPAPGECRLARSLHPYESEHPGDLSFGANQIIVNVQQVSAEWLRGTVAGRSGLFPANFVRILDKKPPPLKPKKPKKPAPKPSLAGLYLCVAEHEYSSAEPGDLSFGVGETIRVLEEIPNSQWLRGAIGDRQGIFPNTFVRRQQPQQPQQQQQQQQQQQPQPQQPQAKAKALYDFTARQADELTFSAGDVIDEVSEVSADWLRGRLGAQRGMFPSSFVQPL